MFTLPLRSLSTPLKVPVGQPSQNLFTSPATLSWRTNPVGPGGVPDGTPHWMSSVPGAPAYSQVGKCPMTPFE